MGSYIGAVPYIRIETARASNKSNNDVSAEVEKVEEGKVVEEKVEEGKVVEKEEKEEKEKEHKKGSKTSKSTPTTTSTSESNSGLDPSTPVKGSRKGSRRTNRKSSHRRPNPNSTTPS